MVRFHVRRQHGPRDHRVAVSRYHGHNWWGHDDNQLCAGRRCFDRGDDRIYGRGARSDILLLQEERDVGLNETPSPLGFIFLDMVGRFGQSELPHPCGQSFWLHRTQHALHSLMHVMVGCPQAWIRSFRPNVISIPFLDRERGRTVANMNVSLWVELKCTSARPLRCGPHLLAPIPSIRRGTSRSHEAKESISNISTNTSRPSSLIFMPSSGPSWHSASSSSFRYRPMSPTCQERKREHTETQCPQEQARPAIYVDAGF